MITLRRDGIEGVDFQTGGHSQLAIDDCNEKAKMYREGKKRPTAEEVRFANWKLRQGGYPRWENDLAEAVVEAGRRLGIV